MQHKLWWNIQDTISLEEMEGFVFIRLKNLNEDHSIQALDAYEAIYKSGVVEKPSAFLANIIAAHQGAQGLYL